MKFSGFKNMYVALFNRSSVHHGSEFCFSFEYEDDLLIKTTTIFRKDSALQRLPKERAITSRQRSKALEGEGPENFRQCLPS